MNTKIAYSFILAVLAGICPLMQGAVISLTVLPATGTDAALGISSSNDYTHAFNFAESTTTTINGVSFTPAVDASTTTNPLTLTDATSSKTLDITRTGGSGLTYRSEAFVDSQVNIEADGASSLELFGAMIHVGGNMDYLTFTINDLTPGTSYSARIYGLSWSGNSEDRKIDVQADTETLTIGWNDPAGTLDADGGVVFYADITYTATGTSQDFILNAQQESRGPHLSGFTNQVAAVPEPSLISAILGMGAVFFIFYRRRRRE